MTLTHKEPHASEALVRLLEQLLPADAARRCEEALALQPRWLPALVDLAIARMNILDPTMDEAAATAAQEAVSLAPGDARAKYVLAYIRGERQRRFADAAPPGQGCFAACS